MWYKCKQNSPYVLFCPLPNVKLYFSSRVFQIQINFLTLAMSCLHSLHLSPYLLVLVNFWWSGTVQSPIRIWTQTLYLFPYEKILPLLFLPPDLPHTIVCCQSGCQAARFSLRVPYNQHRVKRSEKHQQRLPEENLVLLSSSSELTIWQLSEICTFH